MKWSRRHRPLTNPHAEAEQFRRRAVLGFLGIAVAMLGLAAGYYRLQVLQHDEYRTRSEANRIKLRAIVPARGLIYDRQGRLLADNVPAYRLELVPEQVDDMAATLAALRQRVDISDEDLERFEAARRASRRFQPIPLKLRLTESELARLAVDRHRFPGVEAVPYLTRRYPYGALLAHAVGYVGRIDEADLRALGDSRSSAFTHIGKTGIERYYEERLRGEVGYEEVETDVRGRALRVLRRHDAVAGEDLHLSIDAELQQAMAVAFDGQPGAAVALDPRSGEVLAMVSLPAYDPNLFVNGISRADYALLREDPGRPEFNRVVLGGFVPGSTVKPFMALAGLEYGLTTPERRILSTGMFHLPGQERGYGDWRPGGHGWIDLRESLAQSVNTYYYQLALELGIDRIETFFAGLGFGAPTGIDLVGEASGVLPSRRWKREQRNEEWYPGETVNAAIGQGYWVATPLQLVVATAALGADGIRHRPHLLRASQRGFGEALRDEPQPPPQRIAKSGANLEAVREGLVAVVHSPTGSARRIAVDAPYRMAGKTGTAQRVSRQGNERLDPNKLPFHLRHQALFIGYAPAEAPTIALAVVVEHGGSGSTAAAPVARRIFDAWLLPRAEETKPSTEPSIAELQP
ncbi:MAG TPA: penicillin-binding protein 2 [Arenimonas sp.]|nr:penicillin-binding protein 2 [Arenimonas sp.]